MKSRLLPILIANLFAASAFAQDTSQAFRWTGSIDFGVIGKNLNATDEGKAREYRDLDGGVLGGFDIKGRGTNRYWVDAFGENLFRDDMYVDVKGGRFGDFKYQVFYDSLVHNWATDARSPLRGVGGSVLTGPYPVNTPSSAINTNPWSTFDLKDKKHKYGAMFEYSGGTPWFIRADYNEKTDKGLKLVSSSNGTSPGNGFSELPSPLDWKARNFSLEGGYASRAGQLTVSALHSRFSNSNDNLSWQNQFFGNLMDNTTLAADNVQTKFSINGVAKQLPFNSTLSGRFTYANTTNNIPIGNTILTTSTGPAFTGFANLGNVPNFTGKVEHTTAAVSWHVNPTREFDVRPYWYYFKKDNRSPIMDFTNLQTSVPGGGFGTSTGISCGRSTLAPATVVSAGDCETETLSYKKNNLGIEGGYRFSAANRVIATYDYVDLKRNRIDYNDSKDNKLILEWRNSSFDNFGARLKYWRLDRDSNFLHGSDGVNANDPAYLNRFVRKYDAAGQKQDLFKVMLDYQPAPLWDLGLEGILKDTKYKDVTFGRTKDYRDELYASVAYGDMNSFRILGFADFERVTYDSYHRNISTISNGNNVAPNTNPSGFCTANAAGLNCFDPNTAPNTSNYNWSGKAKDWNYAYGIGVNWAPIDRLKLFGSLSYSKTKGDANFATPAGLVLATPVVPINISDNTTKIALNLKGNYTVDKRWDIIGGYAYERYRFKDIAYDGFQYMVAGGLTAGAPNFNNTASSFLSGAQANPNYSFNTIWIQARYKLD